KMARVTMQNTCMEKFHFFTINLFHVFSILFHKKLLEKNRNVGLSLSMHHNNRVVGINMIKYIDISHITGR
ncbi:hypothetical protein ACJX0J_037426, partial [Zea mays]